MSFEKNIEVLKMYDPELASRILTVKKGSDIRVVNAKISYPSLKVGNITIHSLYDPLKEAEEWVGYYRDKIKNTIVVFGFGLGYHVTELCKATEKDIIVFEPRVDILRASFEIVDLTHVIPMVRFITEKKVPWLNEGFTVLEHKPSVNLNPDYFTWIYSRLKVLRRVTKGLKIMVVGPIYGGSLPVARYCVLALKKLGHTVDFVDCSIYKDAFLGIDKITSDKMHQNMLKIMFSDFASETVVARCAEFKPDLIFALAQAPLSESSLKKFRDNKIPTAFWFVEDFRLMTYWRGTAPLYDYFFSIQRGEFFDALKEAGVKNFHYLPLAACPDIHRKMELTDNERKTYGSDVSFVGAGYYNRRNFFKGLIDFDFKIWGSEWDLNSPLGKCIQKGGERIDTDEIVKVFNASRININLHSSTYHEGINPLGDFVNPRTFEIAACGGFQLIDYRSELMHLFKIGEEMVCFKDMDDLRLKIKHYLNNSDERYEIAEKARERVIRDHTYEQRMQEMLSFIVNRGYTPPLWTTDKEDITLLVKKAGKDTELGMYLSKFLDKESISLSDIIEGIKSEEGDLSDVEKIFILMDELKKQFCPKK